MTDAKFKIGDRIRMVESPADLNKSVGLVGTVTAVLPTIINFQTGEVAISYGLRLDRGPNNQQSYGIGARESHLELED